MAGFQRRTIGTSSGGAQHPSTARTSDEHLNGVVNLRVRLLEEARKERERCLRSPDSLTRSITARGNFQDSATQTEPDVVVGARLGWSQADEQAQAEAIQAIQRLSLRSSVRSFREAGDAAEREALGQQAADGQRQSAAMREQVKCLELELDSKESAIRVLERTLESRDQELHFTQLQVRRLLWREMEREKDAKPTPGCDPTDYERIRALREQVLELEYQMHLKDLEISRLSAGASRRTSVDKGLPAADEVSTLCGSERSTGLRSAGSTVAASCAWGY